MSRIHDALRKAGQDTSGNRRPAVRRTGSSTPDSLDLERSAPNTPQMERSAPVLTEEEGFSEAALSELEDLESIIQQAREVAYTPQNDALLINPLAPREAPAEEFRTLRTRLNHLQTLQPLHTLVVTSASPAEGKSFTAANLAVAQAQLADKRILLADFDFRRPNIDKTFQIDCAPGITDYLRGRATLGEIMRRLAGTNLYMLTAGDVVPNPLELLNLKECKTLIDSLRNHFDWVVLDSPPLLFAADANLLATMCDGTVLVVRIGSTTVDSVSRALQSLCENNVLGIVVNGARRGELYSKYSYYHDYYYDRNRSSEAAEPVAAGSVPEQDEL